MTAMNTTLCAYHTETAPNDHHQSIHWQTAHT